MRLRIPVWIIGFILLGGCVQTGYQPNYIISDTSQEEVLEAASIQ
jgi:hypothetical protein